MGEALALTWADVREGEDGAVYVEVTKTRSEHEGKAYTAAPKTAKGLRKVPLSPDAVAILEDMRRHGAEEARTRGQPAPGQSGLVFPSAVSGDFMRQDTARHVMRDVCERAGLPKLSPHALRHSAATFLLSRGEDALTVAGMLGHAQTSTTLNLYAHALPDKLRALAFGLEDLAPSSGEEAPAKKEGARPAPKRGASALARRGKAGPRRKG